MAKKTTINITAEQLFKLSKEIFQLYNTPSDIANRVVESLVNNNLKGHDSHGIIRIPEYLGKIKRGELNPKARPQIEGEEGATLRVNCNYCFGQVGAPFGADIACDIAQTWGVATVALKNINHIGCLGEYVELIIEKGFVGLILTAGSAFGGSVAPYRGNQRMFGTNPIAWGIPGEMDLLRFISILLPLRSLPVKLISSLAMIAD